MENERIFLGDISVINTKKVPGTVMLKHEFIVPDHYKKFTCKGGECRNTCCSGWKVTISRQQYFVLHGLSCNKSLRDKMDRTFKPLVDPTPERYAEIVHNYEGNCPLLLDNGLCQLHGSCGEEVLPWICRYYPRGPRIDYAFEATVANSCERTLELLFETNNPIRFEIKELTFKMQVKDSKPKQEEKDFYKKVQQFCFGLVQDRSIPLHDRIRKVGNILKALDNHREQDLDKIDLTLDKIEPDFGQAYHVLLNVSEWFIENSPSLSEYCSTIKEMYDNHDNEAVYRKNLNHFESVIKDSEIKFEKMLINNMFFRQFPFFESTRNFTETYISLVGTYVFVRYIAINLMHDKNTVDDFIDIMSKTFRVITHTRFENNIIALLQAERATDTFILAKLLNI